MKKLSLLVALGLFTFGASTIVKAQVEDTEVQVEEAVEVIEEPVMIDTDGDGIPDTAATVDTDGDGILDAADANNTVEENSSKTAEDTTGGM